MKKVAISDSFRFMQDCFKAVCTNPKAARQQAELLIQADILGHSSHGLNRLGGTHLGMAGFWAQKAAKCGLVGIALTNTSPLLAPTRSQKTALGTNPIAVVAPGALGEEFYLDMATTAVAFGKIEMQRRKGLPLPSGWAQDSEGNETNDPEVAFKSRCLMPLGGGEISSGYKGYGLSTVVEILTGICAGSNYAHHIRTWSNTGQGGHHNLGHCFVAIDTECFAPGFGTRLTDCLHHLRRLEPADKNLPVLVPGDKEKRAAMEASASGAVYYVEKQIVASAAFAEKLHVKPIKVLDDVVAH